MDRTRVASRGRPYNEIHDGKTERPSGKIPLGARPCQRWFDAVKDFSPETDPIRLNSKLNTSSAWNRE